MNKQIAMNIVAKIVSDYKGSGSGNIKLKDFTLNVKSEGKFKIDEICINWDFTGVEFSKQEATLTSSGKSTFHLSLKGISLEDTFKGNWSLGEIAIDSVNDIESLSHVLPLDELKKFFLQ